MDFFGSASSFVTIAKKIAFRNERNKVWIFCSTGRASNDSLGVSALVFPSSQCSQTELCILTIRLIYFGTGKKTSKINGELGSLRDPSQRLEGREGPVRRSLGVRQPTVGEDSQDDVVDSQENSRGTRKKERGRF